MVKLNYDLSGKDRVSVGMSVENLAILLPATFESPLIGRTYVQRFANSDYILPDS